MAPGGLDGVAPRPRLVITRPADQAQAWVRDLAVQGIAAVALPLIETVAPTDDSSLRHWRTHWPQAQALMFVSGAAVRAFFDAPLDAALPAQCHTRFWAPGPGTAHTLAQALPTWGLSPAHIDSPDSGSEQFDSEALWAVVQPQVRPGHCTVVVGGGSGRDWLAQRCEASGGTVHRCEAYGRQAPAATPAWRAQLLQVQQANSAWLFSSSQAIEHLQALAPQADWSASLAVVTHPRIGQAAQAAGFGRVCMSRPTLADVVKTLKSTNHDR